MKVVVQRVKQGSVKVDNKIEGKIGKGFVCFVGFKKGNDEKIIKKMAKKIVNLRIFEDQQGKMNHSLLTVKGELLVVSQFTLYADTEKGNRPSFFYSELPERAFSLYNKFIEELKKYPVKVKTGIFGAKMEVKIINDGPVTIILEEE